MNTKSLQQLEADEQEAKVAWQKAIESLEAIRNETNRLGEKYNRALRAVVKHLAERQRQASTDDKGVNV